LSKWVRRNRVVAALAALLVVAVISAIVIGAMMGFRIRQANQRLSETVRYLESQTYEELAAKGQPAPLLAWLASRMRQDPFDSGAASRAISVLSLRNFVLPDGPPLVHPAQVNDAQFSPDGAQIMTGCEDGAVRFWDTATRRLLRAIPHTAGVMEASYLAGGTRILVTTRDNVARVYDTATHALLCEVGHLQTQPLAPVESGDGGWLYAAHRDLTVSRWDLRSGQRLVPTIQVGTRVERLRRSNRGSCVAIGCADGAVLLIDAATGQPLHPARHFEAIDNLFFTPDGRRLLIPLQKGARVARWDFGGMDQVSEVIPSNPEPMLTMTASPDGRRLFTSAWGAPLRILDAETLERVATTVGQPTQGGAVYSLSHDGSRVAGFTQDGVALIWDSRTARPLFERFEHQGWIRRLEFSPDDTHVLTASDDGTARLWDVRMHLPPPVSLPAVRSGGEAVFNHAGTRLVVGVEENTFQVCDGRTGQPVGPPLKIPERARIRMNAFSPDDTKVLAVVIGKEGIIRVWEATTLQPGLVLALGRGVNVAEFSRDGRSIVAGDRAGYATVWDAGTGKQTGVISDYNQEVVALDLHPKGGAFLTAGVNGTARCWTLPTAQPASPPFKHRGIVWDARYSPEGDRVVTASADHTAQVWDARTGRPLTKPMSHEKGVYSARFSPNGECVLTTSEDGTARVWSARTGDPLSSSLRHGAQVWMGAFGPDSRLVATGSGDHTARLWDGRSGLPVSEPLAHPGEVSRLSFDPLGQRLLTLGGAAQLWDVLVAPAPVPPWFCDLVEAVAGTRLASDGQVLPVSPEVFEALRKRWAAPNQTDFYARWAHWFLNDRQHDPAPRFLPR
ncbi:MAG TPA: hypothetical protein VN829_19330, partial [Dongiaceae bacterium]|nr:hypothetical protein [Dongiaceae bacterium]